MELTKLIYPNMRSELIDHLSALADPEYQERVWVKHQPAPGIEYDEFDYVVHFLFDDTSLATDPESCIGWYLTNEREVVAVRIVVNSINVLFDKCGKCLKDSEYLAKPEWLDVVAAAKTALGVFKIGATGQAVAKRTDDD